jgi:hypothetical protein
LGQRARRFDAGAEGASGGEDEIPITVPASGIGVAQGREWGR